MQDIACTLNATDLRDRGRAWLKIGHYVAASEAVPGGLELTFRGVPGLRASLAELVRLEAECCAWMKFATADGPEGIRLAITAAGEDGARGVRESFAPLTRG